jgi:phosphatidylglycerophosphatase A
VSPAEPRRRIELLLATSFGVGYAPFAPGTFGSLPGLAAAALLTRLGGTPALVAGMLVVAAVGFLVAGGAARALGSSDPGPVVIDEVAGQMLTLVLVPANAAALALGFFLFRALDVLKPYPANRLERLPGGAGIMADDLAAGAYAALLLRAAAWLAPGLFGLA